ncbi:Ionotropic receptor 352 [Blattella germanica]|nr:Ionotropic receptor 352 [Blattella germanica]
MNNKNIVIIVGLFSGCQSLLSLPENRVSEEYLAECIINISKTYFDKDKPLFIQTPSSILHYRHRYFNIGKKIIEILHNEYDFSKIIFDVSTTIPTRKTETIQKPGSLLIIIPQVETKEDFELVDLMKSSILKNGYNPKGKVLIAAIENTTKKKSYVNSFNIFSYLCAIGYTETIIMEPDPTGQYFYIIGSLINEQEIICSLKNHKMKYFDSWSTKEKRFVFNKERFPTRQRLNLGGCVLKVFVPPFFPYAYLCPYGVCGLIRNFYRILENHLHFKLKIVLDQRDTDISFPYIDIGAVTKYECLVSYPFFKIDYGWLVPSSLQLPKWKNLFYTFSPLIWALVLLTFVCGSFTMWLLQISSNHYNQTSKDNKEVILTALLTHLEAGVGERYKGLVAVLFFTLWLYYCMIINTAYQSQFFELLVNPIELPRIMSINELKESELALKRIFYYENIESVHHLAKYPTCLNVTERCWEKLGKERIYALLIDVKNGLLMSRQSRNSRGKPKFELLDDREGSLLISLAISKWSLSCILQEEINLLLHRLQDAGMLNSYYNTILWANSLVYEKDDFISVFSFSLTDLQSAFCLLYFGLFSASFIYTAEICIFCLRNMIFLRVIRWSLRIFTIL